MWSPSISLFIDIDEYIPGLSNYIPFICLPLLLFDIYQSIKYLNNKHDNEIRLKSSNDTYLNILLFIFGLMAFVGSIIFFSVYENEKMISLLFFISGLLLILKGVIIIPSALIKQENKILYFENGKQKHFIEIEQIESIVFTKDDLILKLKDGKNCFFQHLELHQTDINNATIFFRKYFDRNIEIN